MEKIMTDRVLNRIDADSREIVTSEFNDRTWKRLLNMAKEVFSIDEERPANLRVNPVFKLIGALPFLAGCDEPERTALSHMSIFLLAASPATRPAFSHNFRDSANLERRMERISHFPGGQKKIINRGMKLLSLAMLSDHVHDIDSDRRIVKLNPVGAGHWDAHEIMKEIRLELLEHPCLAMDSIIDPTEPPLFWDN